MVHENVRYIYNYHIAPKQNLDNLIIKKIIKYISNEGVQRGRTTFN